MKKNKSKDTIIVLMLALGLLFWVRKNGVFLGAAGALGVLSLGLPGFGQLIHRGWMGLSRVLGMISGHIVLTIAYVLVLLPLSFFAKISGKSGLRLKRGGDSYFRDRGHTYNKEDLINPW